jgi:transglutaminase-like putative cysteine protease
MDPRAIVINDQPVAAGLFGEGHWLSDYVTPEEPDIKVLFERITAQAHSTQEATIACWDWVANEVTYKPFISARIDVEGQTSETQDFWQTPSMCSHTHVGNCANKAFLLTSLVRNALSPEQVHCVLGNLYNGHAAGHAWVEARINGKNYILESTRNDVPLLEVSAAARYEPVHYFNEKTVWAIPGRTVLTPFQACYSSWLRDYLNWSYINKEGQ